jgi:hypothetical protein
MYTKFKDKQFLLDHSLQTNEVRSKLLAIHVDSFNEDHLLKIQYPASPDAPDLKPSDEEVILFANKKGELVGRDLLGFAMDWIEGILNWKTPKSMVSLAGDTDPNPANTPYGKAYWRLITTESDLSPKGTQYPSVASIQHVWGGWHMERNDFLSLLDQIQEQFQGTKIASYRLIEPEAFSTVKSIDFFRVTEQLSVLPGGLDKIRDLLLQPDAKDSGQKLSAISNFFKRISEKMDGGKARAGDKEMFDDIMTMLGNGNHDYGVNKYNAECKRLQPQAQAATVGKQGVWKNGTFFDCLVPWVDRLLTMARAYPANDKQEQTRWLSNVLYILDEQIPMPQLLKYLGEENYIFFVRINGFRTGDEDADLEYFANTLGDPSKNLDYANGLFSMFASKTRISPIELDRSLGSFR